MRALLFTLCLLAFAPQMSLAQTAGQPTGTIAVEASADQDAAIANRIRAILSELDGYDDVTVMVKAGIVTLRGSTLDTATAARLDELVGRVEGVVAIENNVAETTDVVRRLNPAVERFRARALQLAKFLPLAGVALCVFVLVVLFGFFIARRKQPWDRLAPNAFIADIYRQILRLLFIIGGLVAALDILNATALLSGILGAAGIVGLAIGFAVRDTVENFIASIMLSIRQPFRPNDTVEIEGDTGKVIRLTSRATILMSFDGNQIRIPNATVFKSRIVNFSRNAERRFSFEIGVDASEDDLANVRDLAENTIIALPFTLEKPAPDAWIDRIGEGSMVMQVTGWIDQTETSLVRAKGEAIRQVIAAVATAGYDMPNTTYRIEVPDGLKGAIANFDLTTAEPEPATAKSAPTPDPLPAQDVETREDELTEIVDQERTTERTDLLRENGAQE
ncbi:mechanosensitive ion channel [Sulfitobacter albidus]|uniref:Small-conductance mechanosensitive channel n=1 Tax=Sulfitobacter albidus TaxID=2829501 RepID=A0A975JE48_9RHOB|nr:mechanosensitive ion channel family protein [Sulfitobacter albidus]QUJ76816.1 mechanosensitive ion channel [Sulfitobacter albidus]